MKYAHVYVLPWMLVFHTACGQNQTNAPQDDFSKRHNGHSESQIKELAASKVPMSQVRHIKQDRNGNILIAASWSGAFRYDGKSFQNFTTREGLSNNDLTTIMEDKAGRLWFGSAGGVLRYDGKIITDFRSKEDQK